MDLSHWDLVEDFMFWDAACLAGGGEPRLSMELPPELKAKATVIFHQLEAAYEMALSTVSFAANRDGWFDENETWESIFTPFGSCLPSNRLERVVRACLLRRSPISLHDMQREEDENWEEPEFSRKHLQAWFDSKGFKPVYRFQVVPEETERQTQPQPTSRDHVSDRLAMMNQAAAKFWSNVNRDYRGSHPDNATVAAWLVQRGFSPTLASSAATIIRPEWVPTGRKPEE